MKNHSTMHLLVTTRRLTAGLAVAWLCSTATAQTDLTTTPGASAPAGMAGLPPLGPSLKASGLTPALADQPYARQSKAQTLDLYRPAASGQPAPVPVLVYIHGGGFRFGSKTMASAAMVKAFLSAGYAVASLDYRLSGEAPFPAAVQDVFAAVACLKRQAAELGLDARRVAVFGESAGANLAALLGTAHDAPLFRQTLPDPSVNLRPQALIVHYPPVDFGRIDAMLTAQGCDAQRINHASANSFESHYLGAALPSVPDRVAQANPVTYVSAGDPRFLVQNGDQDCNVGSTQSLLLVDALRQAGVPVGYDLLAGAGHGGAAFESEENLAKMLAFLRSGFAAPD